MGANHAPPLSDRERDVMRLIGEEALTNGDISERLGISVGAVKNIVSMILVKRRLRNRTAVAADWANMNNAAGGSARGKKESK